MKISTRLMLPILAAVAIGSIGSPAIAGKPSRAEKASSPSADISVSVTDTPDPATMTTQVEYALTVTNAGPSASSNAGVSAWVPHSSVFVDPVGSQHYYSVAVLSVSSSQGTCAVNPPDPRNVTDGGLRSPSAGMSCDLGALGVGSTARVTVRVQPLTSGSISFIAGAWSELPDPLTSNNYENEETTITAT